MTYNHDLYHRLYGRHSNIPDCCIEFFIHEFPNVMAFRFKEYEQESEKVEQEIGKKFEYRPCWECLKNKRWNQIHVCTFECIKFLKELEQKTGHSTDRIKYLLEKEQIKNHDRRMAINKQ